MSISLVHMQPKLDRLLPWAQRQGLIPDKGQGDLGYAFHAALKAAFGDIAPQPFSYRSGQGLLAYSAVGDSLRAAVAMAAPDVADMLGLDESTQSPGLLVRPFPENWQSGQMLSFEVRARPIVRTGAGPERDVFLAAIERAPDSGLIREAVYEDWLAKQFSGCADLPEARLNEFKLSTVVRKGAGSVEGGRPMRMFQGPDAVFTGLLSITDPTAFAALVARGIGRHRAFGFGMLLLKPATSLRG